MAKILLIDDDFPFRKMLRMTLEKMGHAVIDAANGREGLELYQREPADLVITDLIMPEKEGLETILDFRRHHRGVRIMAISGGGRVDPKDYLQMAKRLGAAAALAKPFSTEELAAGIEQALSPTWTPSPI